MFEFEDSPPRTRLKTPLETPIETSLETPPKAPIKAPFKTLLKSDKVTFIVGPPEEPSLVECDVGSVARQSQPMAEVMRRPEFGENGNKIELTGIAPVTARLFAKWCKEGRLPSSPYKDIAREKLQVRMLKLLDVCFFAIGYQVYALQQDANDRLRLLIAHDPSLITHKEVWRVWAGTAESSPLRILVTLTAVLNIDTGNDDVGNYGKLAQVENNFFYMFHDCQRKWMSFCGDITVKSKPKKFAKLLEEPLILHQLRIHVPEPEEWVKEMCDASLKKEAFAPGEVIELD